MSKLNLGRNGRVVAATALSMALVAGGVAFFTPASAADSKVGGTLTLQKSTRWRTWDPTRLYTGEYIAMLGTWMYPTLTTFKSAPGDDGNTVVPDLATNTGIPSNLAKTWTFFLKSGRKFQNGAAITCKDMRYAIARVYAGGDGIVGGPSYPMDFLNITQAKYPGPYSATAAETAAFNKVVKCGTPTAKVDDPNGLAITFYLNQSVADFFYTTTLLSYTPIAQTEGGTPPSGGPANCVGINYTNPVCTLSSGPYMVDRNATGKSLATDSDGKVVLVRNPYWNADGIRNAYPDKIVLRSHAGSTGALQATMDGFRDNQDNDYSSSIWIGAFTPQRRSEVWNEDGTGNAKIAGRYFNQPGPFVDYWAFNAKTLPCLPLRKAVMYGIDAAGFMDLGGGTSFVGAYADNVISPVLGAAYTHLKYDAPWGDRSGAKTGTAVVTVDPKTKKTVTTINAGAGTFKTAYTYMQTAKADKSAGCKAAVARVTSTNPATGGLVIVRGPSDSPATIAGDEVYRGSLERLGIKVRMDYNTDDPTEKELDPNSYIDVMATGWAQDYPSVSTVIPPLFGAYPSPGSYNLSHSYADAKFSSFNSLIKSVSKITDPVAAAAVWAKAAQYVVDQAWALPSYFGKIQDIWGGNVKGNYMWQPFGSYAYNELYLDNKSLDDSDTN